MKSILVVGSGFSGSVIAHELSKQGNYKITLIDERDHLGGNCFTEKDPETGITIHKYGPHIFNTDNTNVWDFISQFCELVPFIKGLLL
jgi:UDP-galactopyranose mutase